MIERMLVKVSSPSYDSFGTAATFSTPRPPEKKTARKIASAMAPTHVWRRFPIMRWSPCYVLGAREKNDSRLSVPRARGKAEMRPGGICNANPRPLVRRRGGCGDAGGD